MKSLGLVVLCILVCILISAEAPGDYYYKHWCGSGLTYLDDAKCQKRFPPRYDRNFVCPTNFSNLQGFNPEALPKDITFDTTLLKNLVPSDLMVAVIAIRRNSDGKPLYKYLSNGNHLVLGETWSSSKIFAASNGAVTLNEKCSGGLSSHVKGVPLGDLITIICSYDTTQGYSSNELAFYFTSFGGIQHGLHLVQNWLQRPNDSFGGSYGAPLNKALQLGFTFSDPPGSPCTLPRDTSAHIDNTLSAFTAAEFLKRIAMHREESTPFQVPGFGWEKDAANILYGPEKSVLFPDQIWGGMSADTGIFIQSALDMDQVEKQSQGNWRIFGKLGYGYSNIRNRLEMVSNGYACIPVLDSQGKPVPNSGLEFVISARYHNNANNGPKLDDDMHAAFTAIVKALQTMP